MNQEIFKNWKQAQKFWDNFNLELYLKIKNLKNGNSKH